jgi:DNA-binding NarL/FixJ family response regulator
VGQGKAFFSPKISRILTAVYTRHREQQVENDYELLTTQERQVLQLLAEGRANKDIAAILVLSPTTVISHRQHIFQKLEIHTLAELILYALRNGVIAPERDRMAASPAEL